MVFAAASVSFSQSASSPTVSDLLEANKTLRLLKNNADAGLTYQRLGEFREDTSSSRSRRPRPRTDRPRR